MTLRRTAAMLAAVVILAVGMLVLLYKTAVGQALAGRVPEAVWTWLHARLDANGVESQMDAELWAWSVACLVAALGIVAVLSALLPRRRSGGHVP